jgi:superfamily II DNA or RNA helicase
MASEGLDILALDTLFMLTPKGDVNQSVGRILRKQFDEYEYPPLIVDFVDEIESVKRLGFMRMRLYKSRDYIINGEEPEVKQEVNLVKEVKPEIKPEIKPKLNFNKSLF